MCARTALPLGTNLDATRRNHLIWSSLMCIGGSTLPGSREPPRAWYMWREA